MSVLYRTSDEALQRERDSTPDTSSGKPIGSLWLRNEISLLLVSVLGKERKVAITVM